MYENVTEVYSKNNIPSSQILLKERTKYETPAIIPIMTRAINSAKTTSVMRVRNCQEHLTVISVCYIERVRGAKLSKNLNTLPKLLKQKLINIKLLYNRHES